MTKIRAMAIAAAAAAAAGCVAPKCADPSATVTSPDGRNEIRLYQHPLSYEVLRDGVTLVSRSPIDMTVDGRSFAAESERRAAPVIVREVAERVLSPVYKKSTIDLSGRYASVLFGDWSVELAARDDGVAYRFATQLRTDVATVESERAEVALPPRARCYYNTTNRSGLEETVPETSEFASIDFGDKFAYLPFAADVCGKTVLVTESDVFEYPILNFTKGEGALVSKLSGYPKRTYRAGGGWLEKKEITNGTVGVRWVLAEGEENFLVRTSGERTYPWRVFMLADEPSKLCEADIVAALARPPAPGRDFSWVKPGKVAWDWWNAFDNQGAKGVNTKTYKRFIDFAAKSGVEYVIMDEGWSKALDIWTFNPEVDVPGLVEYAKERGVGIILWMAWGQVVGREDDVAEHFAKLGAKGFKVDFMDRGDADVERFLWTFAEACAKNRMLVDYHGAHRPTGMSRAYPNVLNYEGIHGLEQMKWFAGQDMMANDVMAFYLRLSAGPMDYTPGAMRNFPVDGYPKGASAEGKAADIYNRPGSAGTRCRQMAMMALYEAPLQMLADSPTNYEKNMECFSFMAATPVVWVDTVGLGGTPSTMAACARKAYDGSWYAAGMTNRDARDFTLDTSFLGAGEWKAEVFRDAPDGDVRPEGYVHETKTVRRGDKMPFSMARGGGFIVRFSK